MYGGWFHFVGTIESNADARRLVKKRPAFRTAADFDSLSKSQSIGFTTELALVRKPFEGLTLVQLDFHAELPWVIAAEEPE